MKENYQKQTDEVLQSLAGRPKLLLHVCCAPCSSYVLEYLAPYFDITVHYYNPNISPEAEYRFRYEEARRLVRECGYEHVDFAEVNYDPERFREAVRGLEKEPEGGKRCEACFRLRLGEAVRYAVAHGYDYVTTTLTISPLKNADLLNAVGREATAGTGVTWLPSDFKKKGGYLRSIELSREHSLYRQNYCGCAFSRGEALRRGSALMLVEPTEEFADEVMSYKAEADSFDGCAGLEDVSSYAEWLDFEGRLQAKYGDGYSPSTVRLAVRKEDGRVVGIIDYRHNLTPFLARYGGNIGYSIRPSERGHGYAGEMLALMLGLCREEGAERLLLTCDNTNIASARTIEKNGGVSEGVIPDDVGLTTCGQIRRYWIML